MIKAADYIADALVARGVTCVFEVIGGMTTHMIDAIARAGQLRIVSMHHEQGAAFAAEGMARITGVPAVAMATSGPGATNLLTGIGSCFFDSVPGVFITGQVNRHELRGTRAIRQLGFQETDIVAMATPITKAAWQVTDPERLPAMLQAAFDLALAGRPGPVLLDIPMDVQRTMLAAPPVAAPAQASRGLATDVSQVVDALRSAERPLVLAGGGVRAAQATDALRRFAEVTQVPVVCSLMGVDVMPSAHPLRAGMLGSYGNRWANLAVARSDVIVVIGSRLDVRQTGALPESFKGERTIYHVDVDAAEINNRVMGCVPVVSDVSAFLKSAMPAALAAGGAHDAWIDEIRSLREARPDTAELGECAGINPNVFMHDLSRASSRAAAYVVDVGQHQMWAAQSVDVAAHQRFLTSGGMGAMGFALPAAIGAALGAGGPVVMIAGDGGVQLNIQELQTVARNRIPLKMVILDNQCHGMVRQFQRSYFESRYAGTMWGYSAPDFGAVARAYGIGAARIATAADIPTGLRELWADPDEPFLLHVPIDPMTDVYPKLAFGRTIADMEPDVQPIEMEST